jgi:hypothetical protein
MVDHSTGAHTSIQHVPVVSAAATLHKQLQTSDSDQHVRLDRGVLHQRSEVRACTPREAGREYSHVAFQGLRKLLTLYLLGDVPERRRLFDST